MIRYERRKKLRFNNPTTPREMDESVYSVSSFGGKCICGSEVTKRCTGCRLMKYCSTECQTLHWKAGHKTDCTNMSELREKYKIRTEGDVLKLRSIFGSKEFAKMEFGPSMKIINVSVHTLINYMVDGQLGGGELIDDFTEVYYETYMKDRVRLKDGNKILYNSMKSLVTAGEALDRYFGEKI